MLGIACGLAYGAEPRSGDSREIRGSMEEREACLRRSMEGAMDIYDLRPLGRAEARARAMALPPDRGASWEGAVDIYALRRPGRAEAHEVRVPGYEAYESADARRAEGELRVYDLRHPGRADAHQVTGICPAADEEAA
jgi:hypothetical protein